MYQVWRAAKNLNNKTILCGRTSITIAYNYHNTIRSAVKIVATYWLELNPMHL